MLDPFFCINLVSMLVIMHNTLCISHHASFGKHYKLSNSWVISDSYLGGASHIFTKKAPLLESDGATHYTVQYIYFHSKSLFTFFLTNFLFFHVESKYLFCCKTRNAKTLFINACRYTSKLENYLTILLFIYL